MKNYEPSEAEIESEIWENPKLSREEAIKLLYRIRNGQIQAQQELEAEGKPPWQQGILLPESERDFTDRWNSVLGHWTNKPLPG